VGKGKEGKERVGRKEDKEGGKTWGEKGVWIW